MWRSYCRAVCSERPSARSWVRYLESASWRFMSSSYQPAQVGDLSPQGSLPFLLPSFLATLAGAGHRMHVRAGRYCRAVRPSFSSFRPGFGDRSLRENPPILRPAQHESRHLRCDVNTGELCAVVGRPLGVGRRTCGGPLPVSCSPRLIEGESRRARRGASRADPIRAGPALLLASLRLDLGDRCVRDDPALSRPHEREAQHAPRLVDRELALRLAALELRHAL